MSAAQTTTESDVASDGNACFAQAMDNALKIVDRVRRRVQRAEDVTLVREAFAYLAEAEQRAQGGAIDNATWRYIGMAVLLADQIRRSSSL